MERYEWNKFVEEYSMRIKDICHAFHIDERKNQLQELEKQIAEKDFWDNQEKAQGIIRQSNQIKEIMENYKKVEQLFQDIVSMADMGFEDPEVMELLEEEIVDFKTQIEKLEEKALLNEPYDMMDCILELHPGAGGTESMDWAEMLYRMYQRFCSKKGFKVSVLDYQAGDEAGIKSVTISIQGPYAYGLFKSERGVHRLVRISPFDANSRRHTSFCSCDIAPQLDDSEEVKINEDDLKIDVFHSSGAGGQSVNTTDSAVRITHKPTGIVVTCQNERSQIRNKEKAMTVLRSKLLELKIKNQEEEMKSIKGKQMEINFGSQIRSYVFCPYTLCKDHRTGFEVGNIQSVMDGDIEGFMTAYLKMVAGEKYD